MNKAIYTIATALALTAGILTGCNTMLSPPDAEAAQAKTDSTGQNLKEAGKTADAGEWEAFKTESETKIRTNELSIADFKDRMHASARKYDVLYLEKIDKLDQQNNGMKSRIDNFDKMQNNRDSFKNEFNHDMDQLSIALNDLLVDDQK